MVIVKHNTEIEMTGTSDFDLAKTFECGQCFRWNVDKHSVNAGDELTYIGVAHERAVKLRQRGNKVFITCSQEDFESIWRNYFDLDRDYAAIRKHLCVDDYMQQTTDFGKGIRLLRQEKWEALCSFIISQNNNIPRIKNIIDTLCQIFGDSLRFENNEYHTFPSVTRLASLNTSDLAPLRCGYRADYIIKAAKAIANDEINLDEIAVITPDKARTALKILHGVGDKVADCVMLFGFHMLDAFPVDVWMKRAVANHYGPDFDPEIFSPYSGIAQQYIFHYMRNG
ncbi:MAG: DNA-3-methyladenine glycosylase 2 family protein [Oscillospiraceae bacterium]|nr:DNA-3-methyladenine glycosylase 2 family protein [Oscillospiraceae bacterium]